MLVFDYQLHHLIVSNLSIVSDYELLAMTTALIRPIQPQFKNVTPLNPQACTALRNAAMAS